MPRDLNGSWKTEGICRRRFLAACGAATLPPGDLFLGTSADGLLSAEEGWRRIKLGVPDVSGDDFTSELEEIRKLLGDHPLCVTEGTSRGAGMGREAGAIASLRHRAALHARPTSLILLVGCAHREGWFPASGDAVEPVLDEWGLRPPERRFPVRFGMHLADDYGDTLCVTLVSPWTAPKFRSDRRGTRSEPLW